ncbi:MAG: NAD-dependent epimerase/dehydratase family protein [Actinobacteria bacterium]|nr:NAD-dependent epimerase/dehydratase family protein [Actinomycetota bacterium]
MNVLVTGGAGFIGSHVARALRQRGDVVRVLDALTQPVHDRDVMPASAEEMTFCKGDVTDKAAWERALAGIDAVVHLAAYQDYMPDFSRFLTVNASGTALLYEVIVERTLPVRRVVVASSQSVYGEGQVRCDRHGVVPAAARRLEDLARGDYDARCSICRTPCPEPVAMTEDFAAPANAYGISKLAAESMALTLGDTHGVESVALRYAIVHGAGQSPRNAYSGLLRSACLSLLRGRAPVVFEDGAQVRDYVAIQDAVSATLIALDHPDAPGRTYNVGGARSWSVLEVVERLCGLAGDRRAPEVPGLFRVGDARHTVGDTGRLRALGWEPATDLPATWGLYWEWLSKMDLPRDIVAEAFEAMKSKGVLRTADR